MSKRETVMEQRLAVPEPHIELPEAARKESFVWLFAICGLLLAIAVVIVASGK